MGKNFFQCICPANLHPLEKADPLGSCQNLLYLVLKMLITCKNCYLNVIPAFLNFYVLGQPSQLDAEISSQLLGKTLSDRTTFNRYFRRVFDQVIHINRDLLLRELWGRNYI